jgi:GcrA cell cycle regulator
MANWFTDAWSEEEKAKLRQLWDEELSTYKIAALMPGRSRNAVIGKANRLGLPKRQGGTPGPRAPKKQYRYSTLERRYVPRKVVEGPELESQPCGILELGDFRCKFPSGDPREAGFIYCGGWKRGNWLPYCDYHMQIAHKKAGEPEEEEVPE